MPGRRLRRNLIEFDADVTTRLARRQRRHGGASGAASEFQDPTFGAGMEECADVVAGAVEVACGLIPVYRRDRGFVAGVSCAFCEVYHMLAPSQHHATD